MPSHHATTGDDRLRRRAPHLQRRLAAAVLALAGAAWAQGITQEAALAYVDPAVAAAQARVEAARLVVAGPTGLGYAATLTPRVGVADRFNDDTGPAWSSSLGVSGTVSYRYNGVTLVREERALARAVFDARVAEREGTLRALRAHAAWWAQSPAQTAAAGRLAPALAALSDGEAAFDRGEIDRLGLQDLQLAADRAELAHREAAYRADAAVATAAGFGLVGAPAYAAIRFELPEPDVDALYAVRNRQLAVAEAEAALVQADLFRVPTEVRLSGSYATESLRIGTEAGMFNRSPGAEITLAYPGSSSPGWSLGLRAEIVIDQSTLPGSEAARQRLQEAQADLTAFLATYPDDYAASRQGVAFAEENLTYAERALDLEERRVADLRSRVDAARADATVEERERTGLERDLDRATTALARAGGALLSAWNGYLTQVNAYLALVQGVWRVR